MIPHQHYPACPGACYSAPSKTIRPRKQCCPKTRRCLPVLLSWCRHPRSPAPLHKWLPRWMHLLWILSTWNPLDRPWARGCKKHKLGHFICCAADVCLQYNNTKNGLTCSFIHCLDLSKASRGSESALMSPRTVTSTGRVSSVVKPQIMVWLWSAWNTMPSQ